MTTAKRPNTKFVSKEDARDNRKWYVVDASGVKLGRLASEVAALIRGKHKPTFAPHVDGGDYVVVLNAEKVAVTGNKAANKMYYHHTGWVGNVKEFTFEELVESDPERIIQEAVWGMLPKGVLGKSGMRSRLKVVKGSEHGFSAQQPEKYELRYTKAA